MWRKIFLGGRVNPGLQYVDVLATVQECSLRAVFPICRERMLDAKISSSVSGRNFGSCWMCTILRSADLHNPIVGHHLV